MVGMRGVLLVLIAATLAAPARAQTPPGWQIGLSLPVLATNNAAETAPDGGSAGPDAHVIPEITVKGTHQFPRLRLSAGVGAAHDAFLRHPDENVDSLSGFLTLALTDGRAERFVPYVAFGEKTEFTSGFGHWSDSYHSLSAGFTSRFALPGKASVVLDLAAGRRFAQPADLRLTFLTASARVSARATPSLGLSLTPRLRVRDYDNYYGVHRRDVRIGLVARAAWEPDWLTRLHRGTEIGFLVRVDRTFSSLRSANVTVVEGGPSLEVVWRF